MKSRQTKKKKQSTDTKIEHKEWEIILYTTKNGKCPVNDFMDTLSVDDKEDMIKKILYLKNVGNEIRRPQGDYLRDKIYELRITLANNNTRTLYFFCYDDYIVLTHTFIKKTDKVPENEIARAIKYKNDFLARFNKENISNINNNIE